MMISRQYLISLCLQIFRQFFMLLLCHTQHLGCLLRIMFPSLGILQHYAEFDTRIKILWEKLLGTRSFGGFIGHLVRCQAIFLVSSSGFGLPFVVRIVALTFLRCLALIALTFVIRFQQDDHLIFLDVVAHVEINTSPF